ncbi:MAG: type IX secretion system protein PorQ [Saprospiraceae bacterium]|nr:type IX secretion system protein PorQ [Saprospiraceae bacterium]
MSRLISIICLMMLCDLAYPQVGGQHTFAFLKLPPSSRITALGGSLIAVRDGDVALAVQNPAALNSSMHQSLSFQHNFHFDGIYNGYASYGHYLEKQDLSVHAGIQFMQYGQFDLADEFGNIIGTFKANELAITVGAAKTIGERMSAGANLRFIQSNLESYQASAIAADIGGMVWSEAKQITASLVVRNVGVMISSYSPDITEDLPIDIQIGISKRLQHLPFRLSITAHTINRWDLQYDSPLDDTQTSLIGNDPVEKSQFGKEVDNFFRHFRFSGEFLLGKEENLKLRFGYDHQRRKELSLASLRSFTGFSLGFGVQIKQFTIDYGFGAYHIAGSTQHVGISTSLGRFGKGILD